jgi:hypothetical protein
MFIKTYDIDAENLHLDEAVQSYKLYCYEDDDCVWEASFDNRSDAVDYGEKYLSGYFDNGFS